MLKKLCLNLEMLQTLWLEEIHTEALLDMLTLQLSDQPKKPQTRVLNVVNVVFTL